MNRILFLASDRHGGGRLRSYWPAAALGEAGWDASAILASEAHGAGVGDLVLIHRPLSARILDLVRLYQASGATVLIDEDDDINRIPKANLHQAEPEQIRIHDQAIAEADGLVVTTAALEDVYGSIAKRCWRVPNRLPRWVAGCRRLGRKGKLPRVGWAGVTMAHRQDLEWIRPAARRMLAGAQLVTVGDIRSAVLMGAECPVYKFGWLEDPTAFYRAMSACDIGIVPLDLGEDRDFNAAKSWLKALEYLTLGIPVVAADLPEQRALLEGTGTGILVSSPDAMAEAVQALLRESDLLATMALAADELGARMAIEKHVGEWERVLIDLGIDRGEGASQSLRTSSQEQIGRAHV